MIFTTGGHTYEITHGPTNDQMNREVAEWLGIHELTSLKNGPGYKCSCGIELPNPIQATGHQRLSIPDFTTDAGAVLLLREMIKRDDFHGYTGFQEVVGGLEYDKIAIKYITTPGALLKAVWEWMKEHGTKP